MGHKSEVVSAGLRVFYASVGVASISRGLIVQNGCCCTGHCVHIPVIRKDERGKEQRAFISRTLPRFFTQYLCSHSWAKFSYTSFRGVPGESGKYRLYSVGSHDQLKIEGSVIRKERRMAPGGPRQDAVEALKAADWKLAPCSPSP